MARFGIRSRLVWGVPVPRIRSLEREFGQDHEVALHLWGTGVFEARLLAAMVDEPERVTVRQIDRWAAGFDNWAVCDGVCQDLLVRTLLALPRAHRWARARGEFTKRAAFSTIASLAVGGRGVPDEVLVSTFPWIEDGATDDRRSVRQAVSWALRQIGKRNLAMRRRAIAVALRIGRNGEGGCRWVASDVLRELRNPKTVQMIAHRTQRGRISRRARRTGE